MAELTRYVCPQCNGVLQFSSDAHKVTCEFCGGEFDVSELKIDVGDEEQVQIKAGEHVKSVDDFLKRAPWSDAEESANLVSHTCNTCGAEIVCESATVATNCPYCGNVMVASSTLAGHQPQMVIPFKVNREKAEQVLGKHVTGKWYLPKQFSAELQHVQGVYVPYYLFSTEADGWAWYDGEKDRTVGDGDDKRTVTDHFDVYRAAKAEFVRVPVNGSSRMPDGHMDAIEPFDYNDLEPFNVGYLAGYLAEVSDESAEERQEKVEHRCESTFEDKLKHDALRNVDRVSRESYETNVEVSKVETTMIPVWLMHCTWENENMLFAVNGQTARVVGDMPHDGGKRALTIILSIVIGLVLGLFYVLKISGDGFTTTNLIVLAVCCILLPILVDGFFMGQVRTANEKHEANDAVERGSFTITERQG